MPRLTARVFLLPVRVAVQPAAPQPPRSSHDGPEPAHGRPAAAAAAPLPPAGRSPSLRQGRVAPWWRRRLGRLVLDLYEKPPRHLQGGFLIGRTPCLSVDAAATGTTPPPAAPQSTVRDPASSAAPTTAAGRSAGWPSATNIASAAPAPPGSRSRPEGRSPFRPARSHRRFPSAADAGDDAEAAADAGVRPRRRCRPGSTPGEETPGLLVPLSVLFFLIS